jgi:hypothetical protein
VRYRYTGTEYVKDACDQEYEGSDPGGDCQVRSFEANGRTFPFPGSEPAEPGFVGEGLTPKELAECGKSR